MPASLGFFEDWAVNALSDRQYYLALVDRFIERTGPGLYIILLRHPRHGGEVEYVGQSKNVARRLLSHFAGRKNPTAVRKAIDDGYLVEDIWYRLLDCPEDERLARESRLIRHRVFAGRRNVLNFVDNPLYQFHTWEYAYPLFSDRPCWRVERCVACGALRHMRSSVLAPPLPRRFAMLPPPPRYCRPGSNDAS